MLLFSMARVGQNVGYAFELLLLLLLFVSCKIRYTLRSDKLIFTRSSSVCDSRNLYRYILFYVFPVFSDLTLAVPLHSSSKNV